MTERSVKLCRVGSDEKFVERCKVADNFPEGQTNKIEILQINHKKQYDPDPTVSQKLQKSSRSKISCFLLYPKPLQPRSDPRQQVYSHD